ncbi:hypothetical protein [Pseudocowpox virus]|uniref:Uncharacterized protein n=1 Tax=Pseudocowpox virus TaxID=129726 RepID=D3IZF5_9POXV|nr:hypothetical protein PCPV_gp010 [Pseudocowpox virus]ADC53909.1 hypothetical protein [Pseudocowpox virus]
MSALTRLLGRFGRRGQCVPATGCMPLRRPRDRADGGGDSDDEYGYGETDSVASSVAPVEARPLVLTVPGTNCPVLVDSVIETRITNVSAVVTHVGEWTHINLFESTFHRAPARICRSEFSRHIRDTNMHFEVGECHGLKLKHGEWYMRHHMAPTVAAYVTIMCIKNEGMAGIAVNNTKFLKTNMQEGDVLVVPAVRSMFFLPQVGGDVDYIIVTLIPTAELCDLGFEVFPPSIDQDAQVRVANVAETRRKACKIVNHIVKLRIDLEECYHEICKLMIMITEFNARYNNAGAQMIDDECVCCQARPHVARTAVWPLAEICRGATVVLAPPLARDRAAGLLAEIRLASQRWVRVRAIRSGRGDMGPLPSVVWAATFSAIRLFMEGTVPAFAACVENGRAAYGMVYVPPEEPRMDGLCVFPTPAEPAALFVRGEEVIAAGAAAAMIAAAERAANGEAAGGAGARGSPAAAGEAASEAMETAGGGAAADDDMEAEAHDFEIEFDQDPGAPAGAARADSDSDEDDESSGPESGDERARSEDDSDSSDSYSAFSSSDEDDSDDADDSWGDSDSGIEEDDDGVGQAIEEEEEEERQVLGAVAEMLGD